MHNGNLAGAAPNSFHLVWKAVDVVYDQIPDEGVAKATAIHLGLRVIREDTHDHLQPYT